jgi:hypothetical protein
MALKLAMMVTMTMMEWLFELITAAFARDEYAAEHLPVGEVPVS